VFQPQVILASAIVPVNLSTALVIGLDHLRLGDGEYHSLGAVTFLKPPDALIGHTGQSSGCRSYKVPALAVDP